MKTYVFLESETNNFFNLYDDSQYIYLYAVKTDDNFNIIGKFEEYIKPENKLTKKTEIVTDISNEKLKNCRKEHDVMVDFLNFLKGSIIIGYHMSFEKKFIMKAIYKHKLRNIQMPYFDILNGLKKKKRFKKEILTLENVSSILQINSKDNAIKKIIIMKKLMQLEQSTKISNYLDKNNLAILSTKFTNN